MNMQSNQKSDRHFTAFLWIVLGILGRLIPHPPNMAPMTSIALFGGVQLSRSRAFAVTMLTMIMSDILLAWAEGHAVFGMWSLFTYSGFALVVLAGMWLRLAPTAGRTRSLLTGSSLFFWMWTNFGIWLVGEGSPYPHTFDGLLSCYVAAIPFLGNALVGDLAWGLALFLTFHYVRKAAPRFGLVVQGA
ncbi:MAG: DUF6580 family putative transport protein [Bdellovibrionota bacterium]